MRSNRIFAIARKEILHILRDPRTLSIVIIMPVLQLLIFGYALNLEIQRIDMAVIDYSRTPASEEFVQAFEGSKYFQTFQYEQQPSKIEYLFWEKKARVALIIPQNFAKQLQRDSEILVQIIIDAADPNAAASIQNYCKAVINNYNQAHNTALALPFNVEPTIWFNPDLKSSYFFVPGILALLLIMISALLTSITITREKETGTMESVAVCFSGIHGCQFNSAYRDNSIRCSLCGQCRAIGRANTTIHHHWVKFGINDFHSCTQPASCNDGSINGNIVADIDAVGFYLSDFIDAKAAANYFEHHTGKILLNYDSRYYA